LRWGNRFRRGNGRFGSAGPGQAVSGSARLGSARLGAARLGAARLGAAIGLDLGSILFGVACVPGFDAWPVGADPRRGASSHGLARLARANSLRGSGFPHGRGFARGRGFPLIRLVKLTGTSAALRRRRFRVSERALQIRDPLRFGRGANFGANLSLAVAVTRRVPIGIGLLSTRLRRNLESRFLKGYLVHVRP
jgi:hypothetical protein